MSEAVLPDVLVLLPPDGSCSCPNPRLCTRLGWHCHGRAWEVYNNIYVDRALARRLREEWHQGVRPDLAKLPPRVVPSPLSHDQARRLPARTLAPRIACCGR
jgi:hypothetical protein